MFVLPNLKSVLFFIVTNELWLLQMITRKACKLAGKVLIFNDENIYLYYDP